MAIPLGQTLFLLPQWTNRACMQLANQVNKGMGVSIRLRFLVWNLPGAVSSLSFELEPVTTDLEGSQGRWRN